MPAVICDEFVFIAGQMASGPEHGLDPRAHVPDHSLWAGTEIRKQTEFIIQERLKPALEAAGSALNRSVKAQVYLKNVADFPGFVDVWSQYYHDIPCAVTVARTNAAKRKKEVIAADFPDIVAFGPCVNVGEFLLPSGLMPIDRDGHVAGNQVSPGFPGLSHAGYTQASAVHDYAEALCKAAGTSLVKVLRAQYFVSDPTTFPGIAMAWASRFGAQPLPFACIMTRPEMPAPGMALIADFWISTV